LIIICLAILPAGLNTWYAHNQEITQSVKKQQLYLAEALQKRRVVIRSSMKDHNAAYLPDNYLNSLQYETGIYKINGDSIVLNSSPADSVKKKASYEQFYFRMANDISNNYYDPQLFPALQDSAADNSWWWSYQDQTLSFWYAMNPDTAVDKNSNQFSNQDIMIISKLPERFKFLQFNVKGFLLLIIIVVLVWGLTSLIKAIAERIFLKKFILTSKEQSKPGDNIERLINEYKINAMVNHSLSKEIPGLIREYDKYLPGADDEEIYRYEKEIIETIQKFRRFYDFIWGICSDKEKYLLFDFARDGLINFKNTAEVYHLLERGILIVEAEEIRLFSASFRAYILSKRNTSQIYQLHKQFQQNSTWRTFRGPLLILLVAVASFIFFTQEQTFQKIMALVAGVTSISSLLIRFLGGTPSIKTESK
jgi:hypothetical protein